MEIDEEELKEGDELGFNMDYDWKYGEPSNYSDEMIYYLETFLNDDLLDESPEQNALSLVGISYIDMLNKVKNQGIQQYIYKEGKFICQN